MSDHPGPPPGGEPVPPSVIPVRYPYPPPYQPPPRGSSWGRTLLLMVLAFSIGLNLLFFLVGGSAVFSLGDGDSGVSERFYSGDRNATDKIAIVHVDGVIMDGMTEFPRKEIERAARDENVKAVVLRINSPGGSITASDDLYRRFKELRAGKIPEQTKGKPLVVSMGALAASGGYYIAMPANYVVAERTTLTGSIGVYAAFPDISKLAEDWGVGLNVIKAGDIKDSGSMFHPMTAEERALWQGMVNNAYATFLTVVEGGRPRLKGKLREEIRVPEIGPDGQPVLDADGKEKTLVRRRADGGIFTADKAEQLGLIDAIGYLDDAIDEARKQASLADNVRVVEYKKPPSLFGSLLDGQASAKLEPQQLSGGAIPRLWYLTPHAEMAGILAAIRPE